jgi:hypothetical protein
MGPTTGSRRKGFARRGIADTRTACKKDCIYQAAQFSDASKATGDARYIRLQPTAPTGSGAAAVVAALQGRVHADAANGVEAHRLMRS